MPHTTIREISGDEMLEVLYELGTYAFRSSPPLTDKAEWQERAKKRQGATYFALFEEGRGVASAASVRMTQNVRGATFGMGGIWGVATHPAARRKGYSRGVLTRLLAAIREAGRPFTCLYPFRESFYQRLGYVTFPQSRKALLEPSALTSLLKKELGGEVELTLISDGFTTYRDYVRQLRERVHGMALFDHDPVIEPQDATQWVALARAGGELVGLMLYDLKGDKPTLFKMTVSRFYYHTSQGRYTLLAWIARHVDQANQVEIRLPPFELPETWLADLQLTTETHYIAPMGRVLDVARIGGMQTGPGRITARVSDPLCPWNEGVWQFETVDDVLQVSPADRSDCDLTIQGLSALVYGTHDPGDFSIRGWGNPSPQVQEALRAMFPPRLPYLHEYF